MAKFVEHENENRYRKYPFSDIADLTSSRGWRVDSGLFIDAMLFPVFPKGNIRLTLIDYFLRRIEFSDDTGPIIFGDIPDTGTEIRLYSRGDLTRNEKRPAGILIVSQDLLNLSGSHEFTNAYLSSSCVIPWNPTGVRTITATNDITGTWWGGTSAIVLLPDRRYGNIMFGCENGSVQVTTGQYLDGSYLRFDVNVQATEPKETPIKVVRIMSSDTSYIQPSRYGAGLQMSLGNVSREDICEWVHRDDAIQIYDVCEDDNHAESLTMSTETKAQGTSSSFDIVFYGNTKSSSLYLSAPNFTVDSTSIVNPINIRDVAGTPESLDINITVDSSTSQREKEMKKLLLPSSHGGVIIECPGL